MEDKEKKAAAGKGKRPIVGVSRETKSILTELRKEINKGSYKIKKTDGEIIGHALKNFLPKWKEELRASRKCADEELGEKLLQSYKDYCGDGVEMDYQTFLRKEVLPKLASGKRRVSRASKVTKDLD